MFLCLLLWPLVHSRAPSSIFSPGTTHKRGGHKGPRWLGNLRACGVAAQVQGGAWLLSPRLCDALMAMDVMLCTASIFNLCAISVDRCAALPARAPAPSRPSRPSRRRRPHRGLRAVPRTLGAPRRFVAVAVPLRYNRQGGSHRQLLLIGATWLLSAAVAAPVLCGLNDVRGRDPAVCRLEDRDYVVYSSVCSFFLPCPLMLLLYWATFRGLRRWEVARRAKLHGRAPRRPSGPGPPSLVPRLPQDPCGPDCAPPAPRLPQDPCGPDCAPPAPGPPQGPCGPDRAPPAPGLPQGLRGPNCAPPVPGLPPDSCDSNCAPPDAVRAAALPPQTPPQTRRRRRAKITGRERKAMRVLPVVVGGFLSWGAGERGGEEYEARRGRGR